MTDVRKNSQFSTLPIRAVDPIWTPEIRLGMFQNADPAIRNQAAALFPPPPPEPPAEDGGWGAGLRDLSQSGLEKGLEASRRKESGRIPIPPRMTTRRLSGISGTRKCPITSAISETTEKAAP